MRVDLTPGCGWDCSQEGRKGGTEYVMCCYGRGNGDQHCLCAYLTNLTKSASLANLSILPRLIAGWACQVPSGIGMARHMQCCLHTARSARRIHACPRIAIVAIATGPNSIVVIHQRRATRSRVGMAFDWWGAIHPARFPRGIVPQRGWIRFVQQDLAREGGHPRLGQTGWSASLLPR